MLTVKSVDKNSIAEELGIEKGDVLSKINGNEVEDVLDYLYLEGETEFTLEVLSNGTSYTLEVERDLDENIGLSFVEELEIRTCQNKCVFCFVDQMPKGLRNTLYVKDDDYRLSFISGSYVTLTNDTDKELDRIIRLHLSPLYVSVHATDEKVRCELLHNRFAGKIMNQLKKLTSNGIEVHTQVVLCKGLNDGDILYKTIMDLYSMYPMVKTLAIVPVGTTKYRDKLPKLMLFDKESAASVIDDVEACARYFRKVHGEPFVYLSDEFYCIAGREVPTAENYGAYDQIENGVGLVRKFVDEFKGKMTEDKVFSSKKTLLVTGVSFYPILKKLAEEAHCPHDILCVKNDFFGNTVTVAGLLTPTDIIKQIGDKKYERIILPSTILKEFGNEFLDGSTVLDFEKRTGAEIVISPKDGGELYNIL